MAKKEFEITATLKRVTRTYKEVEGKIENVGQIVVEVPEKELLNIPLGNVKITIKPMQGKLPIDGNE